MSLLVTRPLDDLSYSRWKDERYWPALRAALIREHPSLTEDGLAGARERNFSAIASRASADMCPPDQHRRGHLRVHCQSSYFYDIETPLMQKGDAILTRLQV